MPDNLKRTIGNNTNWRDVISNRWCFKDPGQIFLAAAQRLGLAVDNCVVFEDALSGVTAAKRGGFVCVGVDRHGHADYFRGADAVVSDLGELDHARINRILIHGNGGD